MSAAHVEELRAIRRHIVALRDEVAELRSNQEATARRVEELEEALNERLEADRAHDVPRNRSKLRFL